MKTINNILKSSQIVVIFVMFVTFCACNDDNQPQKTKADVTEFSPLTGGRNTLLTLKGHNFGTDVNNVQVTINGKDALVKTVTDDVITAEVQKGTSSGLVRVILGKRPNVQILIFDKEFSYISNQVVSTYLGGKEAGEMDGDFTVATLSKPRYLVWGKDNALYIVEDGNKTATDMACIRMAKNNILTTLFKVSESPLVQRLRGIDLSSDGNKMYIANDNDPGHNMGFGIMSKSGDTYSNLIELWDQGGVTAVKVHPKTGAIFIAVHGDAQIYQYDSEHFNSKLQLPKDEIGTPAAKVNINGIAFDSLGTVAYFVSRKQDVIYKANYDLGNGTFSNVEILAGDYGVKGFSDGVGAKALFNEPCQADVDEDGNLYVADRGNHCIRIVTPEGEVSTYAGQNKAGNVDGIASQAMFNNPEGCLFGPDGALYVADYTNNAIRKIEETSGNNE